MKLDSLCAITHDGDTALNAEPKSAAIEFTLEWDGAPEQFDEGLSILGTSAVSHPNDTKAHWTVECTAEDAHNTEYVLQRFLEALRILGFVFNDVGFYYAVDESANNVLQVDVEWPVDAFVECGIIYEHLKTTTQLKAYRAALADMPGCRMVEYPGHGSRLSATFMLRSANPSASSLTGSLRRFPPADSSSPSPTPYMGAGLFLINSHFIALGIGYGTL